MERRDTQSQCGMPILDGHYCLLRLLQQRPRLNLYLGRRERQQGRQGRQATLVAVRELLLDGLTTREREQVEYATFQEFVSPLLPDSTRLPTAADLQRVEGKHHYTVIHLDHTSDTTETSVLPLNDLLLHKATWPYWLDERLALRWSIQLARLVARLHHAGVVLGDLSPGTVLVNDQSAPSWAPLLLPSWPPPPRYWPHPAGQSHSSFPAAAIPAAARQAASIFPFARTSAGSPFAAPETQDGKGDPRSDIYSLGAILYLLLAHYAPPSARHRAEGIASSVLEQLELPPLYLFEDHCPEMLDLIVQRTLALDPDERYHTAFELVEALEVIESVL